LARYKIGKKNMRYLGIDYGEKRVGIALSDPLGLTAQPRAFLANNKSLIAEIGDLLDEFEVTTIILGLPKDREGNDSAKALEVRAFAEKLKSAHPVDIVFKDERYSTKAVERHLIAADVSRGKRKKVIDSAAAAFILQGFLDAMPS